jgi:putative thioredoxin
MSLAGGMDLSKLKSTPQTSANTLQVASLVTEVTEKTLPTLVKISGTAPVIIEFYETSPDPILEQIIRAQNGQIMLARVNSITDSRVAEAFGVKTNPALFALVKGQPVPVAEGPLVESQYLAIVKQLLAGSSAQGVSGLLVDGGTDEVIPELPKPLQEALELVDAGQIDDALVLLNKLKNENPKDLRASALLAQVNLMKRTMDLKHEEILESQPTTFDEATVLADVLAAIGDFQSCFDIMLSLYPQVQPENKDLIKLRLLEYFEIAGNANDAVKVARAKLATLLY